MENNKKIYILFYLFSTIVAHTYPLLTFLGCSCLLVLIFIFAVFGKQTKHSKDLGYNLIFILFILWPCFFYIYLQGFVQGVMEKHMLINEYASPVSIKMDLESFGFWALRFSAVEVVKLPILNLEIDSFFIKQFIFETYYCLAVFCKVLGLKMGIPVFF